MNQLAALVETALSAGSLLALPLALLGGILTGLNPCCLPLYPAAAATCCAARGEKPKMAFRTALAFILGAALTTTVLGVLAAAAGRSVAALGGWPRYLIALVPLAVAVHLLGWVRIPMPQLARPGSGQAGGAFVAGLLLSLIVAPCGTPVLAAVLSCAAFKGSVPYGAVLLFLFGLGAGIPMLLVGTTAAGLAGLLDARGWRLWVDRGTAAVLLALGFYLLWTA